MSNCLRLSLMPFTQSKSIELSKFYINRASWKQSFEWHDRESRRHSIWSRLLIVARE